MEPSQVRRRVLEAHEALKAHLVALEALARRVLAGEYELVEALQERCGDLLADVEHQSAMEDAILAPALLDVDAWGQVRVDRLLEHHRQQHQALRALREALQSKPEPKHAALRAVTTVAELQRNLQAEEQAFLNRVVLRDDPIGVDVETG